MGPPTSKPQDRPGTGGDEANGHGPQADGRHVQADGHRPLDDDADDGNPGAFGRADPRRSDRFGGQALRRSARGQARPEVSSPTTRTTRMKGFAPNGLL